MSRRLIASIITGLLIILNGCQQSPEDARRELGQLGVQYTPAGFVNAAASNDATAVKLFLIAGMDPNVSVSGWSRGTNPLISAVEAGHIEIAQMLLAGGAQPHPFALRAAAEGGHLTMVEALLAKGADPTSALNAAAKGGHLEVIAALLAQGADPNVKNDDGNTALVSAALNGHLAMVEALLAQGVDPNVKSDNGHTPLHLTVLNRPNRHLEVVEALLAQGADPNTVTSYTFEELTSPEIKRLLKEAGRR